MLRPSRSYARVMQLRRYHPPAKRWWDAVRKEVFKRDGWKCQKCGYGGDLVCHHTTYKHLFFEDSHLGDLQTLCDYCHREVHGKLNFWEKLLG